MNKNHLPRITLPTRSPALSLCFLLLSSLLSATHLASYLHSTRTPHTHTRTFIHKANHQPPLFLINLQPLLYPNMHVRLCFIIGGKQSISRCLETHKKKRNHEEELVYKRLVGVGEIDIFVFFTKLEQTRRLRV